MFKLVLFLSLLLFFFSKSISRCNPEVLAIFQNIVRHGNSSINIHAARAKGSTLPTKSYMVSEPFLSYV